METPAAAPAPAAAPSSGGGGGGGAPQTGGGSSPPTSGAPGGQPGGTAGAGGPPSAAQEPRYLTRKEKVDGKEVELRATEEELWAAHRKGSTVDRRFEEAALLRRRIAEEKAAVEARRKELREGDWLETLRKERGEKFDPVQELTERLQLLLNDEEKNLDPRNRELAETRRQLAEAQEKERTRMQTEAQQQFEAKVAEQRTALGARFTEALKVANLPRNDQTVALMAQAYRTARDHGMRDIGPEQLAKATQKLAFGFVESVLKTEDDDQLLELLPALTQRIHKALVGRYNKRKNGPPAAVPNKVQNPNQPAESREGEPRIVRSREEAEAYGIKGLRTI